MTKRNVGGMLLGLIASVTAAIASCSFPTYEITVTGTSGSTGGASATASSGSVGGGGASSTGTTSSGAGGSGGGSTSSTSSASSSSTGTGGVCVGDGGACDCDDDKALAMSCATGTDCNDHDPLVRPTQKGFFKDKIAGSVSDYDYDCNGKEDYEVTTVLSCVGLNCDTTTVGWKSAVPACGTSGQFGTCKVNGLASCIENIKGTQVQRCH